MLSTYLESKETIDISLMLRESLFDELCGESSPGSSPACQTILAEESPNKRRRTSREVLVQGQFDLLELDLDKSMAAITATQSPLAVLRTIEWAKSSRFASR